MKKLILSLSLFAFLTTGSINVFAESLNKIEKVQSLQDDDDDKKKKKKSKSCEGKEGEAMQGKSCCKKGDKKACCKTKKKKKSCE